MLAYPHPFLVDVDKVDADKSALLVANDRLKIPTIQLVAEFYPVIKRHYKEVAGTTGTVEAVKLWLPMAKRLGHGPEDGDRGAANYCDEQMQLNREVHALVFFDPAIEGHQNQKNMLASTLQQKGSKGVCWFATPEAARAYFNAIRHIQNGIMPELGDWHDNESAFGIAIQKLTEGEIGAGVKIFLALRNHIVRTNEPKSCHILLPLIQDTLSKLGIPPVDAVYNKGSAPQLMC